MKTRTLEWAVLAEIREEKRVEIWEKIKKVIRWIFG